MWLTLRRNGSVSKTKASHHKNSSSDTLRRNVAFDELLLIVAAIVFLLFKDVLFLLLLRRRQAHRLLPLVVHHLLHHAARLSVQVWQLLTGTHTNTHRWWTALDLELYVVEIVAKTEPLSSLGRLSWCWFRGRWWQFCSTTPSYWSNKKQEETRLERHCQSASPRSLQRTLTFSRWTVTTLPSSMSQELSSTLMSLNNCPSSTGGWPFRPTLSQRRWMSTTTSLPLMRKLTLKGTDTCGRGKKQDRVVVERYWLVEWLLRSLHAGNKVTWTCKPSRC